MQEVQGLPSKRIRCWRTHRRRRSTSPS